MTTKNFMKLSNVYIDNGGGCWIDLTTIYDCKHQRTLYVAIGGLWITVSAYDTFRNELPANITPNEFWLYVIEECNLTHNPSVDNYQMNDLPQDIAVLLFDCMLTYSRSKAKRTQ